MHNANITIHHFHFDDMKTLQYGAFVGISAICIMMLLVFLYGRIIQQIYNHFQVRNTTVWYISDTANIQINDDATTTSSAKVPGIKERTGLKCTFTGTHRSQRNNLRMMKKVIVLLIVISVTCFLSFIPSTNKKNNTKQILMIYIHFFDNDILTFHYSTPFSNYESL
jgi:hypothetical protein